jgi:hypothetical protein
MFYIGTSSREEAEVMTAYPTLVIRFELTRLVSRIVFVLQEMLDGKPDGTYLVRHSNRPKDPYTLSLRYDLLLLKLKRFSSRLNADAVDATMVVSS